MPAGAACSFTTPPSLELDSQPPQSLHPPPQPLQPPEYTAWLDPQEPQDEQPPQELEYDGPQYDPHDRIPPRKPPNKWNAVAESNVIRKTVTPTTDVFNALRLFLRIVPFSTKLKYLHVVRPTFPACRPIK